MKTRKAAALLLLVLAPPAAPARAAGAWDPANTWGYRIGFRVGRMLSVRAGAITVSPDEH